MSVSKKLNTLAIASVFATLFVAGLSQAAPHPAGGRVDTMDRAGFESTGEAQYTSGRTAPSGDRAAILEQVGNKVENGRQG